MDDDRAVCDLTASMLELHGFGVLRATSGEEAIRIFEAEPDRIRILVADIVMPAMSGPSLARRLRARRPGLPVLFVSGLVSQHNFEGVVGGWFLPKPYSQRLLMGKVQEVMASSGPMKFSSR